MPTRYEDIYRSDYLAPEDIPADGLRNVMFVKAEERELHCVGVKQGWKLVLWGKTSDGKPLKRLVAVNKTSAKQCAKVWGKPIESYDGWLGKLANLTHVQIKAFGTLKDAVLITPVTHPVDGDRFEDMATTPPAQTASGIQRPQKKDDPPPAPAQTAKPEQPDNVDPATGEVFEPGSFDAEEPLDEITINDIKSTDSKGKTYWFLYCSDNRIYTTTDGPTAALADEKRANKTGVIITADKPLKNSKGIEYYPVLSLK